MNFFDYLNSINDTKKNVMLTETDTSVYSAYMVNRGLSYFPDTVSQANMMNQRWQAPARMQYDFLRNSISRKRRFSKWFKAQKSEDVDLVREYFGYNHERAREALTVLTETDLEEIKDALQKGGQR